MSQTESVSLSGWDSLDFAHEVNERILETLSDISPEKLLSQEFQAASHRPATFVPPSQLTHDVALQARLHPNPVSANRIREMMDLGRVLLKESRTSRQSQIFKVREKIHQQQRPALQPAPHFDSESGR